MPSASPLSWPCMCSSGMTCAILFWLTRASYTMGIESERKGAINYQQSFWTFVSALVMASALVAMIKFIY